MVVFAWCDPPPQAPPKPTQTHTQASWRWHARRIRGRYGTNVDLLSQPNPNQTARETDPLGGTQRRNHAVLEGGGKGTTTPPPSKAKNRKGTQPNTFSHPTRHLGSQTSREEESEPWIGCPTDVRTPTKNQHRARHPKEGRRLTLRTSKPPRAHATSRRWGCKQGTPIQPAVVRVRDGQPYNPYERKPSRDEKEKE